ncbi:hypothetical protein P4N68_08185 [Corynebacterium felinum]|uniref:Secreted protein n=1 Tax=Corynebacterium felinum TaxID=131318 RepID=A0ABU2B8H0_9CORY|nr:hypothetical protein [Corynebacterium felinum]MDF5821056.1 hypothetical protein [Corynebacterium felinum]MDR7354918.1 hypothetical protein [Corynebacterium felinum]WJY94278.1 hypothetical protein CFELI_03180 [Corynebacterium felinum]
MLKKILATPTAKILAMPMARKIPVLAVTSMACLYFKAPPYIVYPLFTLWTVAMYEHYRDAYRTYKTNTPSAVTS